MIKYEDKHDEIKNDYAMLYKALFTLCVNGVMTVEQYAADMTHLEQLMHIEIIEMHNAHSKAVAATFKSHLGQWSYA